MAGSRFPGSRVIAFDHLPRDPEGLQWFCWSSAIRLQLRGQPRNCPLRWTHRIPLNSPCGHYRSQNWHLVTGPSISGQALRLPVRRWWQSVAVLPDRLIARQADRLRQGLRGPSCRSTSADGPGDDVHEEKRGGNCQKPAHLVLGPGSGRQSCLCRSVRNDHSRSPEFCLSSLVSKCSYWRMTRRA